MLEAIQLSKTYKPKKGVPVKALDRVSLRFPDTGMVFLLGKSGSGKSTLLNLLGGLDRCDRNGGEIIIKGVSSRTFRQQHFDSYRNTYVGFIFQEYNVLEEFTVGANIGLALELQGIRADSGRINEILREVDLEGYGARRPNELSGGQKQRVAIARALVKNPKIIMADEPTGALDSKTGQQIFDTLKRLSRDKLVIVVSHDREFSERYADRIIELADGRVISDVEYDGSASEAREEGLSFQGDTVGLPAGYELTEADRLAINEYIREYREGRVSLRFTTGQDRPRFRPTDPDAIVSRSDEPFRPIRSKLPLKPAFKIGASGLKHKKIRLIFTIFLSVISFTLFGLADTLAAYDHVSACTSSLLDSDISYASFRKSVLQEDGEEELYYRDGCLLDDGDLAAIRERTGVSVKGVYAPQDALWPANSDAGKLSVIHSERLSGFVESSREELEEIGYPLIAGRYPAAVPPDGELRELAITTYFGQSLLDAGLIDPDSGETLTLTGFDGLIGRTLLLGGQRFEITGVFDCRFHWARYQPLAEMQQMVEEGLTPEPDEQLRCFLLSQELDYEQTFSLCSMGFVGEGFVRQQTEAAPRMILLHNAEWLNTSDPESTIMIEMPVKQMILFPELNREDAVWIGEERDVLAEDEILLPFGAFYFSQTSEGTEQTDPAEAAGALAAQLAEPHEVTLYLYDRAAGKTVQKALKIVGFTVTEQGSLPSDCIIGSAALAESLAGETETGVYSYAVGVMPQSRAEVRRVVASSYDMGQPVLYRLSNPVTYELDMTTDGIETVAKVFLYIGLGFALFAALMLSNFIGTSIAYKKQEIGILRAIGSRSNDVFRIFFAESFLIAMINFLLSSAAVGIIAAALNDSLKQSAGVLITLLSFSLRQVGLLLAVSLGVAFSASFLPVRRIAAKRPIDAIRNR